jgi:hypothetical protein
MPSAHAVKSPSANLPLAQDDEAEIAASHNPPAHALPGRIKTRNATQHSLRGGCTWKNGAHRHSKTPHHTPTSTVPEKPTSIQCHREQELPLTTPKPHTHASHTKNLKKDLKKIQKNLKKFKKFKNQKTLQNLKNPENFFRCIREKHMLRDPNIG